MHGSGYRNVEFLAVHDSEAETAGPVTNDVSLKAVIGICHDVFSWKCVMTLLGIMPLKFFSSHTKQIA